MIEMKRAKNTFILFIAILSIGFFYTAFGYGAEDTEEIPDWLKRIHFGVDAGTGQKPRIYFETVQPLYQDFDRQHTFFIQPRYSLESGEGSYNLGLGYRRLLDDNSMLLGGNTFFDFEDDDKHYRVGFGLEAFINQIEFRSNIYIGLSPRRLVDQTLTDDIYEKAVDGFDAEIGLPLPHMNWVKLFAGGNWYNYEKFDNKEGWKLRCELKPLKQGALNLIVYDDNKGDTEFRVEGRISVPFEFCRISKYYAEDESEGFWNIGFSEEAYPEKTDHSDKVLDRVEREYKIEVEKYASVSGVLVEIKRGN